MRVGKRNLIWKTIVTTLILLIFFFIQGAIVVIFKIEGTKSALIRGGVLWCLAIFTLLFLRIKGKTSSDLGFCKPLAGSSQYLLFYVPLLVVALSHFLCGFRQDIGIGYFAANLFLTLGIGMAEEIYFRSIICRMWLTRGKFKAVIISSVLFGLCHLLNIARGAGSISTLLQVCFAFVYGVILAEIFIMSRTLVPCIFLHAFHDLCVYMSGEASAKVNIVLGAAQIVVLISYSLYAGIRIIQKRGEGNE